MNTDNSRHAPVTGCKCQICLGLLRNARINEAERRREADLELNYKRFLAGELVPKDDRE